MPAVEWISDLGDLTKEEVAEALKEVTVEEDLYAYLKWLNSPEGERLGCTFHVGTNANRTRIPGLHPSQIAKEDVCALKLYFDATGTVPPARRFDFSNQLTFDMGTAIHAYLQTCFLAMYRDQFEEEVWLKDKRILIHSAHTDGRFRFSKVRFLLEIKTIKEGGNFGWEKVQDAPFHDNLRQLMTYMYLDDCPFGLVLYFCKNNGKLKEHPVVWDQDLWDKIESKTINPILTAVQENKPPLPSPGYHCRSCDYLHGCEHGKEHQHAKNQRRRVVGPGKGRRYVSYRGE